MALKETNRNGNVDFHRFEAAQHFSIESRTVNRYLVDLVSMNGLFVLDQGDRALGFIASGFKNIQRRDELAIGIDHDVDDVALVPLTMFASPSLRVDQTERFTLGWDQPGRTSP